MKSNASLNRKFAAVLISLLLVIPTLTACLQRGTPQDNEERVLRIAYMYGHSSQDDYMRTQYTELFEFTHQNIIVELVPAVDWSKNQYQIWTEENPYVEPNPIIEMQNLLEGDHPPDLVILNSLDQLRQLSELNLFQPLDSYIQKAELDLNDFAPAVVNSLQEAGGGTLYALAPTFFTSALLYNKGIFTERGVGFPEDDMTWDEIFDLARQIAYGEGNDRVYGFGFSRYYWEDLFNSIETYAAPLGLRVMDEQAEQMLVDSEEWIRLWESLLELKNERILPEPPDYSDPNYVYEPGPFEGDVLMQGKVGMVPVSYNQLMDIVSANNQAEVMDGVEPIDWDVVTLPMHREAPGVGGTIHMDPILAMNANAQNTRDAWAFIEFITGERWAEMKSRSNMMMMTRMDYIKPIGGLDYNIEAFTKLTPTTNSIYHVDPQLDPTISQQLWNVRNIGYMKIQEVVNGNLTIEEALQQWATEGEAMLKQIRENPDAGGDIGRPMPMPMF